MESQCRVTGAVWGILFPVEGEKPKEDVLDLERKQTKKIFKHLALEQTHRKIHQKATVFPVFYPSAWRRIPFGGFGAGNTCWGSKGQSRTCVILQVPLAPHGLMLEGQREGGRGVREFQSVSQHFQSLGSLETAKSPPNLWVPLSFIRG